MDVAAVRRLVRIHVRQLCVATGLTRFDGTSACNPPQDAPVEPARPHTTIIALGAGGRNTIQHTEGVSRKAVRVQPTPPAYGMRDPAAPGGHGRGEPGSMEIPG